jgi:hypothetical protein
VNRLWRKVAKNKLSLPKSWSFPEAHGVSKLYYKLYNWKLKVFLSVVSWMWGYLALVIETWLSRTNFELPKYYSCRSSFKGSFFFLNKQGILLLFMYFFQHCFICLPSDTTVSEDAGILSCPEKIQLSTLKFSLFRTNPNRRKTIFCFYFWAHFWFY